MRIGIIGVGCVGKAYANAVKNRDALIGYDPREKTDEDYELVPRWANSIEELVNNSDLILMSLPTPTLSTGEQDISIYVDVINEIAKALEEMGESPSIIIKSTITPNNLQYLMDIIDWRSHIGYSPEFLTAANAFDDLINGDMHYVAGDSEACRVYEEFIIKHSKIISTGVVIHDSVEVLSVVKYCINVFLASKVMFFNGIYKVCEELGINYNDVINLVQIDSRMGTSHMQVPGTDGMLGYGGMCFPKDVAAFVNYIGEVDSLEHFFDMLQSIQSFNSSVRN